MFLVEECVVKSNKKTITEWQEARKNNLPLDDNNLIWLSLEPCKRMEGSRDGLLPDRVGSTSAAASGRDHFHNAQRVQHNNQIRNNIFLLLHNIITTLLAITISY